MELEIPVPVPVTIDISDEFIELYSDKEYHATLQNSRGLNFGTKYLDSMPTWTDAHYKNKLLHQAIQSTFIFDAFIENVDRNKIKPNMLVGNDQIYLIDHEISFSFADLIAYQNLTPWRLTENDCVLFQQHLFYNYLKGKNFCCEKLFEKIATLNEDFWDSAYYYLPNEWIHEKYNTIREHLLKRALRINEFQLDIERLLS